MAVVLDHIILIISYNISPQTCYKRNRRSLLAEIHSYSRGDTQEGAYRVCGLLLRKYGIRESRLHNIKLIIPCKECFFNIGNPFKKKKIVKLRRTTRQSVFLRMAWRNVLVNLHYLVTNVKKTAYQKLK